MTLSSNDRGHGMFKDVAIEAGKFYRQRDTGIRIIALEPTTMDCTMWRFYSPSTPTRNCGLYDYKPAEVEPWTEPRQLTKTIWLELWEHQHGKNTLDMFIRDAEPGSDKRKSFPNLLGARKVVVTLIEGEWE